MALSIEKIHGRDPSPASVSCGLGGASSGLKIALPMISEAFFYLQPLSNSVHTELCVVRTLAGQVASILCI